MGSNGSRNFSRTASPFVFLIALDDATRSNGSRNFSRTASVNIWAKVKDTVQYCSNGSRNFSRTASVLVHDADAFDNLQ